MTDKRIAVLGAGAIGGSIAAFLARAGRPVTAIDLWPENVEAIRNLVTEIDTRPAQVLVEATILQSELSENNAFGIDFSLVDNLDITDFINLGGPLGARPDRHADRGVQRVAHPNVLEIPVVAHDEERDLLR